MLGAFLCLHAASLQLHCSDTLQRNYSVKINTAKLVLYKRIFRRLQIQRYSFTAAVQLQRCGLKSRHKQKKP
jgi:hypothetical protein